jgi:hypothetical protein
MREVFPCWPLVLFWTELASLIYLSATELTSLTVTVAITQLFSSGTELTQSHSQSYFTTSGLPRISSPWRRTPWDSRPDYFFQMNTCGHSPYITSSMTRGWDCNLQLLLAFASAFISGSESRQIRDHILLSQIRDFPFCRLLRLTRLRCGCYSRYIVFAQTRTENTASPTVACPLTAAEICLPLHCVATVAARIYRKQVMWSVASNFIGELAVA